MLVFPLSPLPETSDREPIETPDLALVTCPVCQQKTGTVVLVRPIKRYPMPINGALRVVVPHTRPHRSMLSRLWAAVTGRAADPQCEGSRSEVLS